jgi:hypothetical protein
MARRAFAATIMGAFLIFVTVLLVLPLVKRLAPEVSGFADMSCTPGLKPCPEGYFCEQNTCVPILPKYNINLVKPDGPQY